jgi:hypothetical protein
VFVRDFDVANTRLSQVFLLDRVASRRRTFVMAAPLLFDGRQGNRSCPGKRKR